MLGSYHGGTDLAYTRPGMMRGGFIGLILLATFTGCGGGGGGKPDGAVTPADAWVEIGTGTTDFEELAAEGRIDMVAGPQGGHHFIVHARMHGLQPGDPRMPGVEQNPATQFTVWSESGEQLDVMPPPYRLGYESVADDVFAFSSGHIIQVREEAVSSIYGARLRLRVEVTDSIGARVTDERWVVEGGDQTGDAGPDLDAPPAAWVEIGTGVDGFEPIAEESDLAVQNGTQGGHHFFLHSRMMGLVPVGPTTRFRVFDEGGTRVDFAAPLQLDYEDAGGGQYTLPNGIIVQIDVDVPAVYGERFRVTAELTDTDGLVVSDERWVVAAAP